MELKYLVPKAETFGELEFAGVGEKITRRVNGKQILKGTKVKLFSMKQVGEIEVVIPPTVTLNLNYEDKVQLVNPVLTAVGRAQGDRGTIDWTCNVDNIIYLGGK
ncbi:YdcP family protein [Listeria booriae]|uniref:YdcP family protein n=1 Tax=Listeria booriae TaxID=1552123 RepID=A0A841ZXM3_9LIST|nr:DUF961 family protein [Listeria booriae]MBC1284883.1 YdcP family protein [Listeria booriae]MBC1565067.1 YdcP family protein [Listeria booriae]